MSVTVKIGPWGAAGGTPCDINMYSHPCRLKSIRIWSDDTAGGYIKGLSFKYLDHTDVSITVNIGGCSSSCRGVRENQRTIGAPWSTHCYRGSLNSIREFLLDLYHVKGTYNETGVTSLEFHSKNSNAKHFKYGPYGWPSGTEFSLPLSNSVVAAFFGNSGNSHSVKSIGVYTYKKEWTTFDTYSHAPVVNRMMERPIQVGPWGSRGGATFNWDAPTSCPEQLRSFTVRSSERSGGRIYGFSFTCIDKDGTNICTGPWGSNSRGRKHEFCMNKDNYINFIGGTHDEYGITSLRFISTQDVYGPFGCSIGTPFSMLLQDNAAAVSFFGKFNNDIITSIGAYVVPEADELDHTESHTSSTHWIDRVVNKTNKYGSWLRKQATS